MHLISIAFIKIWNMHNIFHIFCWWLSNNISDANARRRLSQGKQRLTPSTTSRISAECVEIYQHQHLHPSIWDSIILERSTLCIRDQIKLPPRWKLYHVGANIVLKAMIETSPYQKQFDDFMQYSTVTNRGMLGRLVEWLLILYYWWKSLRCVVGAGDT